MLFKKLVEQHRVHLVIAHAVGLSFLVADYKVRIHLLYILSHESELRFACWINLFLVMEGNRRECEQRLAGAVHRLNVFLEAL